MNVFNPLTWLRNATRNAFLAGLSDAVQELQLTNEAPLTLADLQTRLALVAVPTSGSALTDTANDDEPEAIEGAKKRKAK